MRANSFIYRWTNTSDAPYYGSFQARYQKRTTGAVVLQHIDDGLTERPTVVTVSSAGQADSLVAQPFKDLIPVPAIVMDAPSTIGSCDDLRADARGSLFSAGRDFVRTEWTVRNATGAAVLLPDCPGISVANPLILCKDVSLLPAGMYSLSLSLRNWIGGSAYEELQIDRRNDAPPYTKIVGLKRIVVKAGAELVLEGDIERSNCNSANAQGAMTYAWTLAYVTQAAGAPAISGVTSQLSLTQRQLFIPAFTLSVGSTYQVQLVGTFGAASSAATVTVEVHPSLPVAKLNGGDRAVSLAVGSRVYVLDAGNSYHPDSTTATLQYVWTCYQVSSAPLPVRLLCDARD